MVHKSRLKFVEEPVIYFLRIHCGSRGIGRGNGRGLVELQRESSGTDLPFSMIVVFYSVILSLQKNNWFFNDKKK